MPAEDGLSVVSISGRLAAVLGLVLLNGFFVASEFALIGARSTKLAELAGRGDRLSRIAQGAVSHLDRYLSATQLGITIASLALGWIGEPAVAAIVDAILARFGIHAPSGVAHTVAGIAVAFAVITFLHVVYGELAPKSLALVMPERLSGLLIVPLMLFTKVMTPFIALLNGTANASLRLFGIQPVTELKEVHSTAELRLLVLQSRAHGALGESDSKMLAGVFDFHEKKVRDVMRPRTVVVGIDVDASEEEVRSAVRSERYSRYPVYEESLDNVIGVLLAKDLWLHEGREPFELRRSMREPLYVPATRSAERVLADFRRTRAHMAVVLDEFGGTAGVVTLEDLVEEVVGDIADEYDQVDREAVEVDGVLELAGSLSLVDVRSDYRVAIPEGSWITLGGFVFGQLDRVPLVGDRVRYPGGELEVVAMDGRRVAAVRVQRSTSGDQPVVGRGV
ncbi:MAG: hemolysin family protein [Gemmatimonadaceae bacterium]